MIQVKSKQEAIQWAKRAPFDANGAFATTGGVGDFELRRYFEAADFSPDLYPSDAAQQAIKAENDFRKRSNG